MIGEIRDIVVPILDSLAWPAFALIALLLIRPYLNTLINLVESIKYKGVELNFQKAVKEAATKAESIPLTDEQDELESLVEMTDPDPRIAVIKSWANVEAAIEELAQAHEGVLGNTHRISTRKRLSRLRGAQLIDNTLAGVLFDMGAARNMIAHGADIALDPSTVQLFMQAAAHLALIVEKQIEALNVPDNKSRGD